MGIAPYYIFQFKFIKGGSHFKIPVYKAIDIFNRETKGLNGLAKRVRLIMAHSIGKIELLGYSNSEDNNMYHWFYKYHQCKQEKKMVF